jgi:predicted polyphosphate/ATP-dependent NAD kinase
LTQGKAAGIIRNQRMLDEGKPDLVIAFQGGDGTADMVRRANKSKIPTIILTKQWRL